MAQFHKFRLNEFSRLSDERSNGDETPPNPSGIMSRFRVSDFVAYPDAEKGPMPTATMAAEAALAAAKAGHFFVDLERDSGSGGAQKNGQGANDKFRDESVSVPVVGGMGKLVGWNKRPHNMIEEGSTRTNGRPKKTTKIAERRTSSTSIPTPAPPTPPSIPNLQPVIPLDDPHAVEWSRVVNILATIPPEAIVYKLDEALKIREQRGHGTLLARLGEIFPAPGRAPIDPTAVVARPVLPIPTPAPAPPRDLDAMAPKLRRNLLVRPPITGVARKPRSSGKNCTRCGNVIPHDTSHESNTCRVPHPYASFEEGLTICSQPRKNNNYRTTWKWRCCGRKVESSTTALEMWPRKDDDKTEGWCYYGDHTQQLAIKRKGRPIRDAIEGEGEGEDEGEGGEDKGYDAAGEGDEGSAVKALKKRGRPKKVVELGTESTPTKMKKPPESANGAADKEFESPIPKTGRKRKVGVNVGQIPSDIDLAPRPIPSAREYEFAISRPVSNGDGTSHLLSANSKRKRGRPVGSKTSTSTSTPRSHKKITSTTSDFDNGYDSDIPNGLALPPLRIGEVGDEIDPDDGTLADEALWEALNQANQAMDGQGPSEQLIGMNERSLGVLGHKDPAEMVEEMLNTQPVAMVKKRGRPKGVKAKGIKF